jgi:hypothetical protein
LTGPARIEEFPPVRLALLALLAAACAAHPKGPRFVRVRSDEIAYLQFNASNAVSFVDSRGRPCQVDGGSGGLLGWHAASSNDDDFACTHDTLPQGNGAAALELSFRGVVPRDGTYELDTLGYSLEMDGRVVSRGSWSKDSNATARLLVEARSAHCSRTWDAPIAASFVTGPQMRAAPFAGTQSIPPLALKDCKAGDVLDVRAVLVGETNRGRIDVDTFGFRGAASDRVFAIVLLKEAQPLAPDAKCAQWIGNTCMNATQH